MDIIERVIFNNLIQHRSVILPGVGMLMVYRVAGSLDDSNGKLTAPSNLIEFSPEVPAGYPTIIDDIQKISEANATEIIPLYKNWIADRCKTNANQDIIIGNIGRATKLENGSFVFTPSKQLSEIINPLEERVVDLNLRSTPPPVPGTADTQSPKASGSCAKNDDQKPNACRKSNTIMISLTVILILCGVAWQVFFKDRDESPTEEPVKVEQTTTAPVITEPKVEPIAPTQDSAATIAVDEAKPVKEEEAKVVEAPKSTSKNYFVIGGLFSTEQNANRFIKMLGDNGKDAEKLEAKSNKIMVSVQSFETEEQAREYLKTARKENPDYWLYIRRQ